MILVTGATGSVGGELLRQLVAAGQPVRAFVRSPQKGSTLDLDRVEIALGDFERLDSLEAAMDGVERVFLASSADPRQAELHNNVVDAAMEAGVRRLVKLSALGSDEHSPVGLLRQHWETEAFLAESGVPHTVLRPHYFMQNFLGFAPTIASRGVFYAPMGEGRISMVDVRDIAAVAARTLLDDGDGSATYNVTGPAALSFADAADALSEALGRTVSYIAVERADAERNMIDAGTPRWLARDLGELMSRFAAGHAELVSPTVPEIGGIEGTSFRRFARDHAAAFKGG